MNLYRANLGQWCTQDNLPKDTSRYEFFYVNYLVFECFTMSFIQCSSVGCLLFN